MALCYLKLFYDMLDEVEPLSMEERGRLMTAMLQYARDGASTLPLTGAERILFPMEQSPHRPRPPGLRAPRGGQLRKRRPGRKAEGAREPRSAARGAGGARKGGR